MGDEELEQRARQYSPTDSGIGNAYDIKKFFPAADHGSILITSRLPGLTKLGKSVPIQKLNLTEAIQLLLNNSGLSEDSTYKNPKGSLDTLTLANRLGGLPLAIVIATAFMRQTGTTIA
ncbi:protein kinase subdomain-containing protein [Penicillium longicatenatum]|nr:protein kinase subdomain-containing protein [Penicillium longicatenatum]